MNEQGATGRSKPGSEASADIVVRRCDTMEDYQKCVELEFLTWGEDITVPTAVFVVAHHTGGQVLGAFEGEKMAGFTQALVGNRNGTPYLHSHMTAVRPEYRDRGVGRRLKLLQREDALEKGIRLVEWTFDPLEIKNARFNFVRLGAVARRFIPNCYGITESPLHAGLPTDRLVAEWWLDSERVKRIVAKEPPAIGERAERISLPADVGKIKAEDREAGARIQAEIGEKFQKLFARGYVATTLAFREETVEYILEPADSIAGLQLPKANAH